MHADSTAGHPLSEAPPPAEPPTASEWAIGAAFVLGALLLVAWIAWSLAAL